MAFISIPPHWLWRGYSLSCQKSYLSVFPALVLPGRFSCNQLKALRYRLPLSINQQQVDEVGRDGMAENVQTIACLRPEQSLQPPASDPVRTGEGTPAYGNGG